MIYLVTIAIFSFFFSYIITRYLIFYLTKNNIIDSINERSNHKIPTPRAGGIAIISVMITYLIICEILNLDSFLIKISVSIMILSIISLIDDIKNISALIRLIIQSISIYLSMKYLPDDKLLFKGQLPIILDRLIILLCILWFVNIFNFMDGIDGIASSQIIYIFSSLIILSLLKNIFPSYYIRDYILIIFSTFGFLIWNWQPAKIFLGDVGSVTLGFITGWSLMLLSIEGYNIQALMIPIYYLVDSGVTILKRMMDGKKIWEAHSEHFYQKAVRIGMNHSDVVKKINNHNIINISIVITSFKYEYLSIILSIFNVIFLIYRITTKNINSNI